MSKYNKKSIMIHAWNLVFSAKAKNKVIYIADAMRKAWTKAKEALIAENARNEMVKLPLFSKILRETEKALFVQTEMQDWNGFDYIDRIVNIWLPKSQTEIKGNSIYVKSWVMNEKAGQFTVSRNVAKYS